MPQQPQSWHPFRTVLVAAAFLMPGLSCLTVQADDKIPARPANRLAGELSPYLRQHAHNPVDWYPWGPEAFARAKKEGKLVFLSIGYSSCHWCHVMERESFDNDEVAKLLNKWFVCIKVDREERPDIDAVYMTALQVLDQRGGWPLSMFLTAEGKPIVGGTYWPPEDRQVDGKTLRGFKSILQLVRDWQDKKLPDFPDLDEQATRLAEATREALIGLVRGRSLKAPGLEIIAEAVERLKEEYDPEHGGFGSRSRQFRGAKFPTPPYLELLQAEAIRTRSTELSAMVRLTLERMARGGIYDQLGGGFHRYSTERTWTVPHFEKMLYDNAQLLEVYARQHRLTPDPLYARILRETVAFIDRELTAPEGGWYSALDADSEGEEGRHYVWRPGEIQAALGADAALFQRVYGADGITNFEGKYHILTLPKPLAERAAELQLSEEQLIARLAPLREKLLAVRSRRPRPFLDTKVITGWNGQLIAGYAAAGQALADPGIIARAAKGAEFLLHRLRTVDGRLLRIYAAGPEGPGQTRIVAYLDDYSYLVHGLLRLYDVTHEERWLTEARRLTEEMIRHHSADDGGFYFTAHDQEQLFARAKDQYDGAQPSGNSMAARNLVRLWQMTGDERYRQLAAKTFRAFAGALQAHPTSLTTMTAALAAFLDVGGMAAEAEAAPPAGQTGGSKSDSRVQVTARLEPEKPEANGKQQLLVTLTIDKGWHIYANPVGLEDLEPVRTTVSVRAKEKPKAFQPIYPKGKEVNDPIVGKYRIYDGKVTIEAQLERAAGDSGPLLVSVRFQACNEKICLLPAMVTLKVP